MGVINYFWKFLLYILVSFKYFIYLIKFINKLIKRVYLGN